MLQVSNRIFSVILSAHYFPQIKSANRVACLAIEYGGIQFYGDESFYYLEFLGTVLSQPQISDID
jgi:hypothetical protein